MRRLAAILVGLCVLLGVAGGAEANGSPLRVVLTYLPEVSNWGPQGATGVAELVPAEGEVRVIALGLPRLSGEVYAVWLVNSRTGQSLEVGQFNVNDQSEARLGNVLPQAIPDEKWDMLLVTVEKEGTSPVAPGERRAIAGPINDQREGAAAPQQLPRTGGTPPAAEQPAWPLVAAAVAGAAMGAAGVEGLHRRRQARPGPGKGVPR